MKKLIKVILVLVTLGVLGIFFITALLFYFSFDLPKIDSLADYRPPIPSQILSKDGVVLAELGVEDRVIAQMNEIPKVILDAFLSAEDDSFFQHKGVDYGGMIRAMLMNLKSGKVVQGGSTITQQVAKSLLLTSERSYARKIKDILLAQRIEKKFSKEEILFLYLNQVYLGGGNYGIKNAFHGYFGKELSETTVAEAALMAGLLVAPGRYSPYINPKFAIARQRYVLSRMHTNNRITTAQYEEALKEEIKYRSRKKEKFKAPYFTDWVRQRVIELVGEEKFFKDGFRIVTTLDWQLQQVAENEVVNGAKEIDKRQGYKGPLGTISLQEELANYEKEYRKKLLKDKSEYFTIDYNNDFLIKYELEFQESEYQALQIRNAKLLRDTQNNIRFYPGLDPKDTFVELIQAGECYKAVVVSIDSLDRIVYFSLGGAIGIIPYEQFSWAKERVMDAERPNYSLVSNPSSILKPGDIIQVKILNKSTLLYPNIWKNSQDSFKKQSFFNVSKQEKYLLGLLDQEPDVQGALLSLNPNSGEIVSFVGGIDFDKNQFNRVTQSKRQPGSSFKPILYAAALEEGFTPATIVIDSPEALGGVDESLNWKPKNYDGEFLGPMTFRTALELSRNVPTIKIAEQLGINKITDFVDRICFDVILEKDLSLALGSFGASLMEMVTTYSIFPNRGKIVDAKSIISIVDRDNTPYFIDENIKKNKILEKEKGNIQVKEQLPISEVIKKLEPSITASASVNESSAQKEGKRFLALLGREQVYDERLAYIMSNLLRGVVLHGTGREARSVGEFIGGKTGTTSNYVDAWFIGFSSNLTTGVWTGFDDNKTLGWGETGTRSALPIWKNYMGQGLKKYGEPDFAVPKEIIFTKIIKETGRTVEAGSKSYFVEAFVEGTEPGNEEVISQDVFSDQTSDGNSQVTKEKPTVDKKDLYEDEYFNNQ